MKSSVISDASTAGPLRTRVLTPFPMLPMTNLGVAIHGREPGYNISRDSTAWVYLERPE